VVILCVETQNIRTRTHRIKNKNSKTYLSSGCVWSLNSNSRLQLPQEFEHPPHNFFPLKIDNLSIAVVFIFAFETFSARCSMIQHLRTHSQTGSKWGFGPQTGQAPSSEQCAVSQRPFPVGRGRRVRLVLHSRTH
jgi:hypothetical protein